MESNKKEHLVTDSSDYDPHAATRPKNLEQASSFWSYLFIAWLNDFISLGATRNLLESDIPHIRDEWTLSELKKKLNFYWREEKTKKESSLLRSVFWCFGPKFFFGGICKVIADGLNFMSPIILSWIILFINNYNTNDSEPLWHGYVYAVSLFLASALSILFTNEFTRTSLITGLTVRSALVGLIYEKSLKLSPKARLSMPTGKMVNMMSVDASKIDLCCGFFHLAWTTLIQITVAIALLIYQIGYAALPGIAMIFLFIPIQSVVTRILSSNRANVARSTDSRLKMMNEILQGIKVIKVYAWERSFAKALAEVRNIEMKYITIASRIRAINGSFNLLIPTLTQTLPYITLSLIASDGRLSASQVFSSLVLFNLIRIPVIMLPQVFTQIADARIAFSRIQQFLLAEEIIVTRNINITSDKKTEEEKVPEQDSIAISINEASFTWESQNEPNSSQPQPRPESQPQPHSQTNTKPLTLPLYPLSDSLPSDSLSKNDGIFKIENISLSIKKGSLVAIIGNVASGKSSLVQALLGEMKKLSGSITINGNISYCPQQPWIQNTTLQKNILFGKPFDSDKYQQTLYACSLISDLKVLPSSDQTEIGERGINLSGGQKQRVSLARSVYHDADIVIWDDPLSAVDSHVSRHLFDKCICGVLKDKTRLLVTHQLQYIHKADLIIYMKDGKIAEIGSYNHLINSSPSFSSLIKNSGLQADTNTITSNESTNHNESIQNTSLVTHEQKDSLSQDHIDTDEVHKDNLTSQEKVNSTSEAKKEIIDSGAAPLLSDAIKSNDTGRVLIRSEEKASGNVDVGVVLFYLKSMGGTGKFLFYLALIATILGGRALQDWFLAQWSVQYYNISRDSYIGWYVGIGSIQMFGAYFMNFTMSVLSLEAAHTLNDLCVKRIIRAPMSFFDTTPLGRIINRFSTDQDVIDNTLGMENVRMTPYWICSVLAILILIAVFNPFFIIVIPFLFLAYIYTQNRYRKTSRELKRFDAIGRSPLYAHFQETVSGLSTIRAYQAEELFIKGNEVRMNANNRPYSILQLSNRWLGERLEFMGSIVILSTALIGVSNAANISPGLVGLTLTYALQTTIMLTFLIRNVIDTENNFNAVERIKYYIENVPQESPESTEADKLIKSDWPTDGNIVFQNVSFRYRDGLPLVLNNISCNILPGQRIGVVGRTGAGKSSLMLALYRLVELASGKIIVDGVDIATLGTFTLRSKLSIMPQDPVLYSGTVRSNLDPFNNYSDDQIWAALDKAYLSSSIKKLPLGLESQVFEGGENFSVGQRCQICLARAMIRQTKIIIMDEATASIDLETDALIQQSLRNYFTGTVLTIAHRLNTIMDYDKVMVLSFGEIKEFDQPAELLTNPESLFYKMVQETGPANAQALTSIAMDHQNRLKQNDPKGFVMDSTDHKDSINQNYVQYTLHQEATSNEYPIGNQPITSRSNSFSHRSVLFHFNQND